jgi:hypothetical protein
MYKREKGRVIGARQWWRANPMSRHGKQCSYSEEQCSYNEEQCIYSGKQCSHSAQNSFFRRIEVWRGPR